MAKKPVTKPKVEKDVPLTPQQELFCAEFLIDLNATQSAIRAGYSANTANQQGSRLLANVKVQNKISELQEQRLKRLQIDSDMLLKELVAENRADIADLYSDDNTLLPVKKWPLIWRTGLIAGIDTDEIWEGRGEDKKLIGYTRKVKISDRIKRKELIGKHAAIGAFKERVEVDASDPMKKLMQEISGRSLRPAED